MNRERKLVIYMCKICPKCGAIAEYNAYYGRTTCTRCDWESEKKSTPPISRLSYKFSGASKRKPVNSANA